MKKYNKVFLLILLVLNAIVLLGQIWPDGAPPFAAIVNIVFLSLSFLYFVFALNKRKN